MTISVLCQYGSVKGERAKGKSFKYILYPLPLNLFPDHKGSSYCLSKPYWVLCKSYQLEGSIFRKFAITFKAFSALLAVNIGPVAK